MGFTRRLPMVESPRFDRQLERDLERARAQGRWLSHGEELALAEQQQQRRKLWVLLLVCLVLPPLWPVALGLTLYLLFPSTTQRWAVRLGLSLLALAVVGVLAGAALLVALIRLLL